jgi:hypothetical protein
VYFFILLNIFVVICVVLFFFSGIIFGCISNTIFLWVLCSWRFCSINKECWEWCAESLVSDYWSRLWNWYCLLWFRERSQYWWSSRRGWFEHEIQSFLDMHKKYNVVAETFAILRQVSFRLELTTPACPVKDMVNDTIITLW